MTLRTPLTDRDRLAIRSALAACSQVRFDRLAVDLVIAGIDTADFERVAREELAAQPAEVQHWWGAPCNCHGGLN